MLLAYYLTYYYYINRCWCWCRCVCCKQWSIIMMMMIMMIMRTMMMMTLMMKMLINIINLYMYMIKYTYNIFVVNYYNCNVSMRFIVLLVWWMDARLTLVKLGVWDTIAYLISTIDADDSDCCPLLTCVMAWPKSIGNDVGAWKPLVRLLLLLLLWPAPLDNE